MTLTTTQAVNLAKLVKTVDWRDYSNGIDDEPYNGADCLYYELGNQLGWSRDEMGEDPGYDSITVAGFTSEEDDAKMIEVEFENCSFGDVEDALHLMAQALAA